MDRIKNLLLLTIALLSTTIILSSCSNDDDEMDFSNAYDIIEINGNKYACYGYRLPITYASYWDLSSHSGDITLPLGKLSDAQKGEYDYEYMLSISLEHNQDLKKGQKLEDFSYISASYNGPDELEYISGSATIIDKKDDTYITIKFDSFELGNGKSSYVLNGTVQLMLDED